MSLSIARHAKLTKTNPEYVVSISDLAPNERELIVYDGNFDEAQIKVSRRFAALDDDNVALPFVSIIDPSTKTAMTIGAPGAGYLFGNLAKCGEIKFSLVNPGNNTSIRIGVAF